MTDDLAEFLPSIAEKLKEYTIDIDYRIIRLPFEIHLLVPLLWW